MTAPTDSYAKASEPSRPNFDENPIADDYALEMFYDGDCPLCMREVRLLRRLDRHQRLRLTDLTLATPEQVDGRSREELMARMQGRLPNGTWIDGVEVFRQAYAAVGFGWIVALTRLPGVRHALDFAYDKFAKNRLRLTGRCEAGVCEVGSASSV